jgi:hypothetical protein
MPLAALRCSHKKSLTFCPRIAQIDTALLRDARSTHRDLNQAGRILYRALALYPSPRDRTWSSRDHLDVPGKVHTGPCSPGRGDSHTPLTALDVLVGPFQPRAQVYRPGQGKGQYSGSKEGQLTAAGSATNQTKEAYEQRRQKATEENSQT